MYFLYCSSIIAQLIWRSSHGVISNKVHVPDSAWPATSSYCECCNNSIFVVAEIVFGGHDPTLGIACTGTVPVLTHR